ncbi:MAG: Bug family tripartite tricarboxylate transporter substrate binding protein [Burkholderiales bacterium]
MVVNTANAAEAYPTKPVRMVLPGPPGGGADLLARILGQKLTESLGRTIIIDNRPGAGGLLGMDIAAKASPDGYTIVMGNSGPNAVIPVMRSTPYHPVRDLTPVSLVASTVNLLVVHPSTPAKSVSELVQYARSRPAELTFASGGNGQASHLAGELFKLNAKIAVLHVPYKGSGPAVTDLLAGRVGFMFANIPSVMPHANAGKLRVLAVTSAKRSKLLPQLPTMSESGLPGYESVQWYGVLGPAAMPQPIVARLNTAIVNAVQAPDVQEQLSKNGFDAIGSTPREFAAYIRAELDKWRKVVVAAKIAAD